MLKAKIALSLLQKQPLEEGNISLVSSSFWKKKTSSAGESFLIKMERDDLQVRSYELETILQMGSSVTANENKSSEKKKTFEFDCH